MKQPARATESGVIRAPDAFRKTRYATWAFLLGAFSVFVLAVLLLPSWIASALGSITVAADLRAEPIEGTVLLQGPNDIAWKQLRDPTSIPPGSKISTDRTSRAFLELFDGSTVYLHNDTEVLIEKSARGWLRGEVKQIGIRIYRGRAVFGVASTGDESQRGFSLKAHDGNLQFVEGSYLVEMLPEDTVEVLVRSGEAVLFNGNDLAKAGFGGRGGFSADLPPNGDLPPMSPILGDLALESSDSAAPWRSFVVTEAGIDGQVLESATESGADGSGSNVANAEYRFIRRAAGEQVNRHGEAGIAQIANRDIRDYSILHVRAQVKVNFQSLSGGGSAGTEYPIMLKIYYVDSAGQDQIWYHGFYHQNDDGFSVAGASPVPREEWVTYDNPNLLQVINPAPVFIRRVEVLGSGWEFDSWVREISLEGR